LSTLSLGRLGCARPALDDPDAFVPGDFARLPPDLEIVDLASSDLAGNACMPATKPCDLVCQDCGAGQKCALDGNNQPSCITDGTVPTGGRCSFGVGNCLAGDVCLIESTRLSIGVCSPFCRSDGDCTNGGRCSVQLGAFHACSDPVTNCDPYAMTGCASGGCYIVAPGGLTGCHDAGSGVQGFACDTDYDCRPGYLCIRPGSCARLCKTNSDCSTNHTCAGTLAGTVFTYCL
jgi:hypothetical protein